MTTNNTLDVLGNPIPGRLTCTLEVGDKLAISNHRGVDQAYTVTRVTAKRAFVETVRDDGSLYIRYTLERETVTNDPVKGRWSIRGDGYRYATYLDEFAAMKLKRVQALESLRRTLAVKAERLAQKLGNPRSFTIGESDLGAITAALDKIERILE